MLPKLCKIGWKLTFRHLFQARSKLSFGEKMRSQLSRFFLLFVIMFHVRKIFCSALFVSFFM